MDKNTFSDSLAYFFRQNWLVKVDKQQIEVHTIPAENDYKVRKIYKRQDEIIVSGFDLKIVLDQKTKTIFTSNVLTDRYQSSPTSLLCRRP